MSTLTGAWQDVKRWFYRAATGKLHKSIRPTIQDLAKEAKRKVKKHISTQDLNWPALTLTTVSRKGHETVYLETGQYYDNIVVEIDEKRFKTSLRIGPSEKIARKGLTFQQLAAHLEYGTVNMPARPLWGPTFKELKREARFEDILKEINWETIV